MSPKPIAAAMLNNSGIGMDGGNMAGGGGQSMPQAMMISGGSGGIRPSSPINANDSSDSDADAEWDGQNGPPEEVGGKNEIL